MNDNSDDVELTNVMNEYFPVRSPAIVQVHVKMNQYLHEVDQFVRDEDEYVPEKERRCRWMDGLNVSRNLVMLLVL